MPMYILEYAMCSFLKFTLKTESSMTVLVSGDLDKINSLDATINSTSS